MKLNLIDGEFSLDEAREIVNNLLVAKITFHQKNIMTCDEKGIKDRLNSRERVQELLKLHEEFNKHMNSQTKEFIKISSIIKL